MRVLRCPADEFEKNEAVDTVLLIVKILVVCSFMIYAMSCWCGQSETVKAQSVSRIQN